MLRLGYAILLGIVGAGIVHIGVLLLLPQFSERDAWSRLAMAADFYRMVRIDAEASQAPEIRADDPLFYASACRFDLSDGVAHVRSAGKAPFWSVSVYDRSGQNIYSFNDRTAEGGKLDFVVLTPAQMIEVRKALPAELQGSVFVETAIDEGIIVIRGFVPDPSWKRKVADFLSGATCALQ